MDCLCQLAGQPDVWAGVVMRFAPHLCSMCCPTCGALAKAFHGDLQVLMAHCPSCLRRSLMPMLAAFGQAMLLVAPHTTGEGALTDGAHTELLLPFVTNVSLVMAHHSPTRLTSQLGPALHASLVQRVRDAALLFATAVECRALLLSTVACVACWACGVQSGVQCSSAAAHCCAPAVTEACTRSQLLWHGMLYGSGNRLPENLRSAGLQPYNCRLPHHPRMLPSWRCQLCDRRLAARSFRQS